MVIYCSFICLEVFVFSSDLVIFQIDSCRIVMDRVGDHGYWSPTLTLIRSAFNIPDVNILSNSLICVKSLGVMEFVLSFA